MVKRQVPKPSEIVELMQFRKPSLDFRANRLSRAQSIADLRRIAKRRTPAAAFDYTDGSADREISLARARKAFEDVELHPGVLTDVSHLDTATTILGGPSALPFGIAPIGFTRLMQTEGEIAGAGAAAAAGIPFSLSTLGTTSIEDVRATAPDGRLWYQLYVMKDREISYGLVDRAAAAGFDTLLFTVDTPIAGPHAGRPQRVLHPSAAHSQDDSRRHPPTLVVGGDVTGVVSKEVVDWVVCAVATVGTVVTPRVTTTAENHASTRRMSFLGCWEGAP